MRRSSLVPFGLALVIVLFGIFTYMPSVTHAQFFGPIIPPACNCDQSTYPSGITANGVTVPYSAPAWGCVLATFQNVITFGVSIAVVLITIFIAWAGFTYMTSGSSAEKRGLANKRIMNAVIGLIIVLCAYLLVNSLMQVIYNPSAPNLGPWNSILAGDGASPCLAPIGNPGPLPGLTQAVNTNNATNPGQQTAVAPPSNVSGAGGACSASSIESAVQAEGGTISSGNASTLACIAAQESSCGTNPAALVPQNNNGSSALGPFQVLVQMHAADFNNSQCEAVAGVSGPLNCQNAFSGGNPIPGTLLNECEKAADDLGCEAVAASQLNPDTVSGLSNWPTSGSCAQ